MTQAKNYILNQVALGKLSRYKAAALLQELGTAQEKPLGSEVRQTQAARAKDIAIIGMAVRFPGASSLPEYWDRIAAGEDQTGLPGAERRRVMAPVYERLFGVAEIPEDACEPGGYLEEVDRFDPAFFGISFKEALLMSPLQKIMLETVYRATEHAGLTLGRLADTVTGVFIGRDHACVSLYNEYVGNLHPLALTGAYAAVLASRISQVLKLTGPSLLIDTACSSALVAVHQACRALQQGECTLAIAGGINVKDGLLRSGDNPIDRIVTGGARVRTFDESAQGTLISEGAGAVVLKPLQQALADGDPVQAIIRGSAVNNDGGTRRMATPRAETQAQVLTQAWQDAGVEAESLSYVEAHGIGTYVGDPIEIRALRQAFETQTSRKQFCAVSAVKANIGHTVAASGMASLIKAVLALQERKLPPLLHFEQPNAHIDFAASPVYVNDRLRVWEKAATPRRCGVNSFGFGGTNVHVVLEEAPETLEAAQLASGPTDVMSGTPEMRREQAAPGPLEQVLEPVENEPDWRGSDGEGATHAGTVHLLVLSARTEATLRSLIQTYSEFMLKSKDSLESICYTAATGRDVYQYRLALVGRTRAELAAKLKRLIEETEAVWLELNGSRTPPGLEGICYGVCETVLGRAASESAAAKMSQESGEIVDSQAAARGEDALNAGEMLELARQYSAGADIAWEAWYRKRMPQVRLRRVAVPEYPLERVSCWYLEEAHASLFRRPRAAAQHAEGEVEPPKQRRTDRLRRGARDSGSSAVAEMTEAAGRQTEASLSASASIESITEGGSLRPKSSEAKDAWERGTGTEVRLIGRASGVYSEREQEVATVWGSELGLEEIAVDENYYELGGDSISGIRIANRLNEHMQAETSLTELMQHPTVAELAAFLEAKPAEGAESWMMKPAPRQEDYPLSSAQMRMMVHDQMVGGIAYNLPRVLLIQGRLEVERVQSALHTLIQRHETLRTSFHLIRGEYRQRVQAEVDFRLTVVECPEPAFNQEHLEGFVQPFDLQQAPLFRAVLMRFSDSSYALLLDMHHIISDRASMAVLIGEFSHLYEGEPLPSLTLQYKDYANWQFHALQSETLQRQERYWMDVFSQSLPSQELPVDYPQRRGEKQSETLEVHELDKLFYERLIRFSAAEGMTHNMVLFAVYSVLLSKWIGATDISIGTSILGRNNKGLEGIVGMFVNTLAIRTGPMEELTFREFLTRTKSAMVNAYANQEYPYEMLVELLRKRHQVTVESLFRTMFIMQNMKYPEVKLGRAQVEPYYIPTDTRFDLQLDVFESGEGQLNVCFMYSDSLFKQTTIQWLMSSYLSLLAAGIESPDIRLGDMYIPLMREACVEEGFPYE
ncbi:condensation domain-containing protein [Paenibacillus massiliensis]|uniref:condensation domain-containing protein n=2 Tax=Paenibacillus massiliensis TaxID=225917 RepID=UPI0003729874|nr:condensation domain-containing protein [Paenibacillus massiliensis]